MAKTNTMVLVFGFSFPFSAGFQGKSGFSFGKSPVLPFLGLFENTKENLKNTKDFSHLANP